MDFVGYARVVPRENAAEAFAHQKARIESFCREQGHRLIDFYCETVSAEFGLQDARPELQKALAACSKEVGLIVIRLDRLSGNKKVITGIFDECRARDIAVQAVAGPQKPEDMKSSLEVTILPG